jgi:hypothetical protein
VPKIHLARWSITADFLFHKQHLLSGRILCQLLSIIITHIMGEQVSANKSSESGGTKYNGKLWELCHHKQKAVAPCIKLYLTSWGPRKQQTYFTKRNACFKCRTISRKRCITSGAKALMSGLVRPNIRQPKRYIRAKSTNFMDGCSMD